MAKSDSKEEFSRKFECPVCLDYFTIPIQQCVKGHSFCKICIAPQDEKKCPECRQNILETRNYKLEELMENIDFPCINHLLGCKYMAKRSVLEEHMQECKHRIFKCEGKLFCNWDCKWESSDILEHFKMKHPNHNTLQYNGTVSIAFNEISNFTDLQLISAHYQLFWYKHKIDINKRKAYWAFQLIGPKAIARYYYYEFEFIEPAPSVRKYKITEYCSGDKNDINEIFNSEKCVAISLRALKNYVNEKNDYSFRFRIMKIPKPSSEQTPKQIPRPESLKTANPFVFNKNVPRKPFCKKM